VAGGRPSRRPRRRASTSSPSTRSARCPGTTPARSCGSRSPTKRPTKPPKTLKETRGAIQQAPNQEIAAAALAKLSVVYGKHLQNAAAGQTYMSQAEELAGQIESPEGQAKTLLAIAGRYQEMEQADEATRVADAALELARGVEDPRRRSETLAEAAVRLHKLGRSEEALSLFDESEAAAESSPSALPKKHAGQNALSAVPTPDETVWSLRASDIYQGGETEPRTLTETRPAALQVTGQRAPVQKTTLG
jgi:tetratricopeptide (TPR) repeat protein